MPHLLDTCVISALISKRPDPKAVAFVDSLDPNETWLSVITVGEIRKGIDRLAPSRRRAQLESWLSDDLLVRFRERLAPIDLEVVLRWGSLLADMERHGRVLPAMDSLIAATALAGGFILVTRNEADFAGTSVRIENPWR